MILYLLCCLLSPSESLPSNRYHLSFESIGGLRIYIPSITILLIRTRPAQGPLIRISRKSSNVTVRSSASLNKATCSVIIPLPPLHFPQLLGKRIGSTSQRIDVHIGGCLRSG